jgi:hypothetical protein
MIVEDGEVARDGVLPLPGNVDLPNVCDQSRVRPQVAAQARPQERERTTWLSCAHYFCYVWRQSVTTIRTLIFQPPSMKFGQDQKNAQYFGKYVQ